MQEIKRAVHIVFVEVRESFPKDSLHNGSILQGQAEKQWKIEGFPSPRRSLMQAKHGRVSVFLQAVE